MAQTVGRNIAAPLLFLNLLMYTIALGFACWCTNKYIDGQTSHPSFGGNGATGFFLTFAILACVVGIVSKFAGGTHIRVWRSDSLAAAGSAFAGCLGHHCPSLWVCIQGDKRRRLQRVGD
ncbi:hypothetical protein OIU77_014619 [Salix suchowensis]|uniref:Uncharacterized protein n=1 Tax=Salix suchowensis TaxID=1278906 RepID=A0ABQ8ZYU3_9ROSI|nr:hypothetical protein OIU77_014619 [Salix suchowensis]